MTTLLSRKQAAEMLGISMVTLDLERSNGNLAYIQRKPGGKVMITQEAIEDYLRRITHQAKPEHLRTLVNGTYRKRRVI